MRDIVWTLLDLFFFDMDLSKKSSHIGLDVKCVMSRIIATLSITS